MGQVYSNPKRANESGALPDVETFYVDERGYCNDRPYVFPHEPGEVAYGTTDAGWYWQPCFPGCLPDGEPNGPFATEQDAIDDAQSDAWQDDDAGDDTTMRPRPRKFYTVRCVIPGDESLTNACYEHAMESTNCNTSSDYFIDPEMDGRNECDYAVLDSPCGDREEDSGLSAIDDATPDDQLPPCVLAMRCYCAGHARGIPASEPCDTSEVQP